MKWFFALAILTSPGDFSYAESIHYPSKLQCDFARNKFLSSINRSQRLHVLPCFPVEVSP